MEDIDVINTDVHKFDNFAWYDISSEFERVDDTTFTISTSESGILGIDYTYEVGDNKADKFYLSKMFKETYGTTVNNYLISKRITRAKQLLRFTDMTVDEVSAAVGMGDANYFSRMFRKVEGSSPREYRKQW